MMKQNRIYKKIESNLIKAIYNIKYNSDIERIELNANDKIYNIEIKDKKIRMIVERDLTFNPNNIINIEVAYLVEFEINDTLIKEQIVEDIKNGILPLNNIFSYISLSISNLTMNSLIGPVITIPVLDTKTLQID